MEINQLINGINLNLLIFNMIIIGIILIAAFAIVRWATYILKKTGTKWKIDETVIPMLQDSVKYSIYIIAITLIFELLGINNPLILNAIVISVILIASFTIVRWAMYILKKTGTRWEIDITVIQVLQDIVKYGIYIMAITLILGQLGINITTIAVSFGIVGIAVGFAARDTIANFISGIFILADKSFKVGDIIEVSNKRGKVIKMGFRLTTIVTYDKKTITVPNSAFSSGPYVNYTSMDKRRVDLDIIVPYEMEFEDITKSLIDAAIKCEWTLKEPKPKIIVKELSDMGIKAILCAWTDDPWKISENRSSLAKAVKDLFVKRKTENLNADSECIKIKY